MVTNRVRATLMLDSCLAGAANDGSFSYYEAAWPSMMGALSMQCPWSVRVSDCTVALVERERVLRAVHDSASLRLPVCTSVRFDCMCRDR